MPVYNGERFVAGAVESILSQTFTDFELIAVDDGSKDRSHEILQSYAKNDSRIRVHRMERNSGSIAARNTGFRMARAELLAVMDADDISLPHRLSTQAAYLNHHPDVGVLGAYIQFINAEGKLGDTKRFPLQPALMAWSMSFFNSVAHPTVMMRREVFAKTGGYDSSCKGGTEDYDLFSRASQFTRLGTVPEVLVLYRRWEGSMTHTAWNAQETDADRIAGNIAARRLGEPVPQELAKALRGLSTDNYPKTPTDLKMVGNVLGRLVAAFLIQPALTAEDKRLVARDAGVKMWLLAALAAKKSPALAASLARTALSISPASLPAFVSKAAARLTAQR